jgi:tetratricopeptide (TPR) repeat protein
MRSLPVTEVAARLDDRFRLLTGGSRAALPRHQTLRAVVAWSWDLLTDAEAALADRVAVFPGGVTADAAQAVCTGAPVEAADVPDLLAALADKSLLQQTPSSQPRYRMLETIREFGVERLAGAHQVAEIRHRHARHFLALAEEADPHLRRPEQLEWFGKLTAERDNLLAAMRYAVDTADADTATRLGAALAWFWTARSEHAAAATLLPAAADLPGDAPTDARAVCMVVGAVNNAAVGDDFSGLEERLAAARRLDLGRSWADHPMLGLLEPVTAMLTGHQDEAFAMLERAGNTDDEWSAATRLLLGAMLHENEGHFDEHRDYLKRALDGYRQLGERWGLASTLAATGSVRLADGDIDGSVAAYAEAHQLMAEITASDDASFTRTRLALAYARGGDVGKAKAELAVARAESERSGSRIGLVSTDLVLAEIARQEGDVAEARQLVESALHAAEDIPNGPPQLVAVAYAALGALNADDDDIALARQRIHHAATLPMADRDMPVMGAVALSAAYVELRAGRPEAAAARFGAALALRGIEERGSPQVEQLRRELLAALDPDELDRIYGDAAALPREQALDLLRGSAEAS